MLNEIHPDRDSYEQIWNDIIDKEISKHRKQFGNCITVGSSAKEEIWDKYVEFNRYCKINYMEISDDKIDRHKVAACYMLAILYVAPIKFNRKIDGVSPHLALNEVLAITVGLSIVRTFYITSAKKENDSDAKKFEQGIILPDEKYVNHGDYITNYAHELYFSMFEGKLSILSLAHELYLLEVITRLS